MARCEDYPCCGHVGDEGPCPDFDPETGKQLNMRCVCGAEVPLSSRWSLCTACLRRGSDGDDYPDYDYDDESYDYDPDDGETYDDDLDEGGDPYDGDREFEMYGYDYE